MDQAIKVQWLQALRSREYKQVTGVLCRIKEDGAVVGHCCLGILCELAVKANIIAPGSNEIDFNRKVFVDSGGRTQASVLPHSVRSWAGFEKVDPTTSFGSLSALNDNHKSFAAIADIIEKEL